MTSKDFAIGMLSTTAVILLTGLVIINTRPEPAYASGMSAQGGDYVFANGQFRDKEELVYVIDAGKELMLTYHYDQREHRIDRIDPPIDLAKLRKVGQPPTDGKKDKKK